VERVCDEIAIVDHGGVVAAGPLDELLGASTVRIRVTGLTAPGRADLAHFGAASDDPPWIVLRGCPPERVPDLVATLVASGVRVYEVDTGRESLEERFLQLLGHAPEPPRTAGPSATPGDAASAT
jgi:ABC-2 type transport system ATP-binding protein